MAAPMERLIYRGAQEISMATGVPFREVPRYVRDHGLPAFKYPGTKRWLALPEDLRDWLAEQRDDLLGRSDE